MAIQSCSTLFIYFLAVVQILHTKVGDTSAQQLLQKEKEESKLCNWESQSEPFTKNGRKMICHIGLWSINADHGAFSGDILDPFLCTHYTVDYFTINRDQNKWSITPPPVEAERNLMKKVFELKKINPNLKLLIGIGGWTDNNLDKSKYFDLASDEINTRRFATSTVEYLQKNIVLDGIDFQWNYPGKRENSNGDVEREALANFTSRICSVLRTNGYLCMITLQRPWHAITDLQRTRDAFNVIIREADLVAIWTADIPPETTTSQIFHADLLNKPPANTPMYDQVAEFTVEAMMENFTNGVLNPQDLSSRDKLLITIPLQANGFNIKEDSSSWANSWPQTVTNLNEVPPPPDFGTNSNAFHESLIQIPFFRVCRQVRLLPNHDNRKLFLYSHYTQHGMNSTPVAYNMDILVPTNTPESVRNKAKYVNQMRFGGVNIFQLGADDVNGWCYNQTFPLVNAIFDELNNKP